MKTIKLKLYSINELNESAKEKALENYREQNTEIFWADETLESLKGLFKACNNIKLVDYSLGQCNSHLKVSFSYDEIGQLTGKRAMAWVENNLLCYLRIKTGIKNIKDRVQIYDNIKSINRPDGIFINRQGEIKSCPFTGYCTDEDFLYSLLKDIKDGCDLKTAFEGLATEYQKIITNEIEGQNTDEYITEHMDANDYQFLEDGTRY